MKKVLMLVCGLAFAVGANAQVKMAREFGKLRCETQIQTEEMSPLVMKAPNGAAKSAAEDSIYVQAVYAAQASSGRYGLAVYGFDEFFKCLGTGVANHYYGSGEMGYSFDFRPNGWYSRIGDFPGLNNGYITGAIALVARSRSTTGTSVNSKDMPFLFKVYSGDKVTEQEAYTDITSNQRMQETVKVYYPANPEEFMAYSDTVYVPISTTNEEGVTLVNEFGARFATPVKSGDNVCLSTIFPNNHDSEDTLWCASLANVTNGTNLMQSQRVAAMYAVWDFDYQNMWGTRDGDNFIYARGERWDMIPDSNAQPNKRYGITAVSSWQMTTMAGDPTGSSMDMEPVMLIIIAGATDVERGASYDKYVEVLRNPAIDYTRMQATDRIRKVEIYNLNGKLLKSQSYNDYSVEVRLDGLTSGMYVARVTTDAGVANKKIMVR